MATARRRQLPVHLTFDPADFPNLNKKNHRVRSAKREGQNCIAFAADDDIHYWWPIPGSRFPGKYKPPYYWPENCPEEETLAAFECAFQTAGFEPCEDGKVEVGIVKIVIFGQGAYGDPSAAVRHAAKQSPFRNDQWRSKMGQDHDIDHRLTAVEGPTYGIVVRYMRKRIIKQ